MNQHDHEDDLSRALHRRADRMHEAPLGLDDVQGRAGQIRRRRRATIGAGLAAALVVMVPAVVVATGGLDRSSDELTPATASPSAPTATESSPTASPAPSPSPTDSAGPAEPGGTAPFDVSALPTGAPPAIQWSDGRDVHRADGTVAAGVLPGDVDAFAPMGSGWMVSTYDEGNGVVRRVSGSGELDDETYPSEGGLVSSPDGGAVAWAFTNEVYVAQRAGDEVLQLPSVDTSGGYAAAAVTDADCGSAAGCTVFVNTLGEQPQVWASTSTSQGFAERYDEGIQQLTAWRDGAYAGITAFNDDLTTCSAVRSPDTLSTVWETCDHRLLDFSPDGAHLLGVGSVGDGFADGQVAVLDAADGAVLVDLRSDEQHQTGALQLAWEDESHALVVTYADGRWAVVRLGLDGSMEYAVPPRAGSDLERPFFLQS